ncbi:GntR family transcriptional regulator [Streptomyces sp. NPDC006798]|uniref:GntR family transcriptional regulator n=1 Tax=Streptomyces sp. NPDC006798 TaxID=3155462 RepID=UPI0033CB50A0
MNGYHVGMSVARGAVGILRDAGLAATGSLSKDGPTHERLARTMEKWIADGFYRVGDNLPSARHLSEEFRVSNRAVGRAIDVLADKGLVDAFRGRSTTVTATQPWTGKIRRHIREKGYGAGIVLSAFDTAAALGISEKECERAFARLKKEGVLGFVPGTGFYVKGEG